MIHDNIGLSSTSVTKLVLGRGSALSADHIGVRARGLGACPPQTLGACPPQTPAKALFFGQKLNFSGRRQQPKNIFLVFTIRKKGLFILSSEIQCLKSGIFTNNYWVG